MGVPTIKTGPMTVDEFYEFTDRRPDEEKWELIDGAPILMKGTPMDQVLLESDQPLTSTGPGPCGRSPSFMMPSRLATSV